MADFKKLEVWEKAHALSLFSHTVALRIRGAIYASLKNQIVRAAQSIPTNIVEGRGKKTDRDFARFLGYALGSATELEYHIIVARDVQAITQPKASSLLSQVIEVKKMLHGLIARLADE